MKLTERRLRKFFPYNNRLIHFVAKRYGYSFQNNDVVDAARYYSFVNVTRYLKKNGDEFESEGEMIGMVMSSIRLAKAATERLSAQERLRVLPPRQAATALPSAAVPVQ
jgi:hypothetical protein